jgi:hypothetical protein
VKIESRFVQQQNQISVAFGAVFDGGEPDHEAEEPDEALATLVERNCDAVPQIFDPDIEILAIVEGRLVLRIALDVKLDREFLILFPVIEDLLGNGEADCFQFGLRILVTFLAHQFLEIGSSQIEEPERRFIGIGRLVIRLALIQRFQIDFAGEKLVIIEIKKAWQ